MTVRLSPKKTKYVARNDRFMDDWQNTERLEINKSVNGGLIVKLKNEQWDRDRKRGDDYTYIRLNAKQVEKLRRLLE